MATPQGCVVRPRSYFRWEMKCLRSAIAVFAVMVVLPATLISAPGPNVVLILADDLGFSDLGAYGGEIQTPNLDRLAAGGVRFTQFYNCGDCVMTRAALYTGVHPRQGKGGVVTGLLHGNLATLAEVMGKTGYATILSGSWHFGAEAPNRPMDRGFEEHYGTLDGTCDHFDPARPNPDFVGGALRHFARNEERVAVFPANFYSTDAFSEHAVEIIRRLAKSQQRFFLHVSYTAPHFPLQAPAPEIARYKGKFKDGYDRLRERRLGRQIELGLFAADATKLSPASLDYLYEYEVTPWERIDPVVKEREEARMEAYAAMVDRLDQGVGRVLAVLEESGVTRNTVVIFLSDSGGCPTWPIRTELTYAPFIAHNREIPVGDRRGFEFLGRGWGWAQNAPFRRHKFWTYEGGICTPMIVRWPGVVGAGRITHSPAHVVDLMPTLVELSGGEYPGSIRGQAVPPMEGQSLVPLLRGGAVAPRELPLGWELFGNRAIRDGQWKLVWDAGEKVWELYDLATDRTETVDLSARHPERVVAMAAQWNRWAKQTGAPAR